MEDGHSARATGDRGWLASFALQALDSSVNAIAFADVEGHLTYVNRRFLALWGYEDESEVLGRHASSFWTSVVDAELVRRHLLERGHWAGELVAVTKAGATKPMGLTASPILGDDGGITGLMASFIDLSTQRRAERELRRFEFLVEGSSEEIYLVGLGGRITYANPAAARSLGYSVAELQSMSISDLDPERGGMAAAAFGAGAATSVPRFEVEHTTKDGRKLPKEIDATMLVLDGQPYVVSFARDISERKAHEARIAALTRLFALRSQVNQAIVRLREPEPLLQEICRVAVEVGGLRAASVVLGQDGFATLRTVASAGADRAVLHTLSEGVDADAWTPAREALETRALVSSQDLVHEPVTERWRELARGVGFHSCVAVPLVVRGAALGALSLFGGLLDHVSDERRALLDEIGQDVAFALEARRSAEEHARAERALRDSEAQAARKLAINEERLRQAVRVADIGVLDHDHVTNVIHVSPELRRIHQWSADLAPTVASFHALAHPDDRERVTNEVARAHAPDGDGRWELEHRIVRADGSIRWIVSRSQSFFEERDGGRRPVRTVGAVRDVTDEKHAREEKEQLRLQLEHAQKLESVGRLAGGVAHDFNNMLTVILGHADLLLGELAEGDPIRASVVEMERAAQRSAELTRQLLAFARRQPVSPKVLDLGDAIGASLKMLRRLIGDDIELDWTPARATWPVKIDPAQVDQILANLAANARDAIAGHGRISIATSNFAAGDRFLERHPDAKGREYVMLSVKDTGAGMDAETLSHVFEPFFTTKALGLGTGLGLATVFGIVQQNDGLIDVESTPSRGTTVAIYLPRSNDTSALAHPRPPPEPMPGGTETLLLVENESSVLELKRTILQRLGYRVLTAPGPTEALALFDADPAIVDLVVTDVVLPVMNGRELWSRLRQRRPTLPCLFVSAHPADLLSNRGILERDVHFLQKPFTPAELARAVRSACAT